MITVKIGGGGFHNASPVTLDLPEDRVFSSERIERQYAHPEAHFDEEALITVAQFSRIMDDMCGMQDCCCGSGIPATLMHEADYRPFGVQPAGDLWMVPCEILEPATT